MEGMHRLDDLRRSGRMRWLGAEQGWVVHPNDVVDALAHDGFEEYKREEAKTRRDRVPTGGVWQGLNVRTGEVASAIWVARPPAREPLVFIEIDGQAVSGGEGV